MTNQESNSRLKQLFLTFMMGRNYIEVPAVPISSKADRSVRLIGSAFSRLRSFIGADTASVFTVQRAIRTQILGTYFDEMEEREFCSYHVSYGAIVDADSIEKLIIDCIELVTQSFEFEPYKMRVRASSNDVMFLASLQSSVLADRLILDSEDDDRYGHRYGSSLCGRGFKIDCKQGDLFKNVVHVIAIFDEEQNGKCVGAEMALTNSSVLLRRSGQNYAIQVMPVADLLPCDNFVQRRYADSLTVVTHLLYEGVRPNSSRMDGRLLKRYLRALHFFASTLGISEQMTIKHITDYARYEYQDDRFHDIDLGLIVKNF